MYSSISNKVFFIPILLVPKPPKKIPTLTELSHRWSSGQATSTHCKRWFLEPMPVSDVKRPYQICFCQKPFTIQFIRKQSRVNSVFNATLSSTGKKKNGKPAFTEAIKKRLAASLEQSSNLRLPGKFHTFYRLEKCTQTLATVPSRRANRVVFLANTHSNRARASVSCSGPRRYAAE